MFSPCSPLTIASTTTTTTLLPWRLPPLFQFRAQVLSWATFLKKYYYYFLRCVLVCVVESRIGVCCLVPGSRIRSRYFFLPDSQYCCSDCILFWFLVFSSVA